MDKKPVLLFLVVNRMSAQQISQRICFSDDHVGIQSIRMAVNAVCGIAKVQRQVMNVVGYHVQ